MSDWCKKVIKILCDMGHLEYYQSDRDHLIEQIDRVETHYKDIKSDLEKIQESIDPLKTMLIDMERAFRKSNDRK
jgi:hypothetical protein